MTFPRLSLRALTITSATVILAGAAIGLVRPKPIENAVLGAEWQCSRTAFVVTTCARQTVPAVQSSRKEPFHPPRV